MLLTTKVDEERCRRAGCVAVIVKPLRQTELSAVIGRLLPGRPPVTRVTQVDRAAP